jgi:hypothetical protein
LLLAGERSGSFTLHKHRISVTNEPEAVKVHADLQKAIAAVRMN